MPSRANPRDLTGLQAERLATQKEKEVKEAQARMSTITPVEFDAEYTDTPQSNFGEVTRFELKEDAKPDDRGEFSEDDFIAVSVPRAKFRVNTDLEDVTIGAGNTVSFYVGKLYDEPKHIYDHLDEKGYIWH